MNEQIDILQPKLYVVPTPVGNLEDITLRALRILKSVSLVLAEDTRTSAILFKHYDIHTPLSAFHKFNEHKTADVYASKILAGEAIALVSDAGTPSISDPGYLLVRQCVDMGIEVECLPGATAFVPALVNSALPAHNFCFEGFLPVKKGRQTILNSLADEKRTMIFYESPHRLIKTLNDFIDVFGENRNASVSREISKKFEQTIRGTLSQVSEFFNNNIPKGEFVIVISGEDNNIVPVEDSEDNDVVYSPKSKNKYKGNDNLPKYESKYRKKILSEE